MTVTVIAVIGVASVLAANFGALDHLTITWGNNQSQQALNLTEGCMEDALWHAREDSAYAGDTYAYLDGECTVSVAKSGTTWTLTATGTFDNQTRTVEAVIDRSSAGITLTRWQEVDP